MTASNPIISKFDSAASGYDQAAALQQQVASALLNWASASSLHPHSCFDIGSGTGFVAERIHSQWPNASITCLDASPAMLATAKRKMPFVHTRQSDAAHIEPTERYDAIFSSMVLHWLPDPLTVLRHWQAHLQPHGKLFIAVPIEGSFSEWRTLCQTNGIDDGLQPFPDKDFAKGLAMRCFKQSFSVQHNSAVTFLHSMKKTGAATPRQDHRPVSIASLRKLLTGAARPFSVTCRILFLELPARSDP